MDVKKAISQNKNTLTIAFRTLLVCFTMIYILERAKYSKILCSGEMKSITNLWQDAREVPTHTTSGSLDASNLCSELRKKALM